MHDVDKDAKLGSTIERNAIKQGMSVLAYVPSNALIEPSYKKTTRFLCPCDGRKSKERSKRNSR